MHFLARADGRGTARCSARSACSERSAPRAEEVMGGAARRRTPAAIARPPQIGAWFERISREIFDPLMVDRRVDGAYDKTIEKLSPGHEDFPLRMLSPYRTLSDAEFARRATSSGSTSPTASDACGRGRPAIRPGTVRRRTYQLAAAASCPHRAAARRSPAMSTHALDRLVRRPHRRRLRAAGDRRARRQPDERAAPSGRSSGRSWSWRPS